MTDLPTGPCQGCGAPCAGGLLVGRIYTYICPACDDEAEANWQAAVSVIADKIAAGDYDGLEMIADE